MDQPAREVVQETTVSTLSLKARDKFYSLFIDRGVPYMTDFPAAQHSRAESHHTKHVIQGYMEMKSRAGK